MKKWYGMLLICPLLFAAACQKTNNNTPYPQITLKGIYPGTVRAASAEDTLLIGFDFFDGDGDIDEQSSVKLIDSRTGDSMFFFFPQIDPMVIDPATGIEGSTTLVIPAIGLRMRPDSLHTDRDTLRYRMSIRDNAGNESNTVTTPDILLTRS